MKPLAALHAGSRLIDRRTAIKWVATAAASGGMLASMAPAARSIATAAETVPGGYGPDPDILRTYKPGDLWPLTLDEQQRATTTALCDVIIPADEGGPSASAVGVPAFIDEWMSAPYPGHDADRTLLLDGLAHINDEGTRRYGRRFAQLTDEQKVEICDTLSKARRTDPASRKGASFFKRFRDLTAGGYYTTPEGMRDLGYVGNRPMPSFDGPPLELLRRVRLAG